MPSISLNPGDWAKQAAQSAFDKFLEALANGVMALMKFLSTFWLKVPSPQVAAGGGEAPVPGGWSQAGAIADMQHWIAPYTAIIAIISFSIVLARIGLSGQLREVRNLGRHVAVLIGSTLTVAAITQLLITAGDEFSPWIIERAGGGSASSGMETVMLMSLNPSTMNASAGMWIVVLLLCLLGGIVQAVFMVIRGAALIVLLVLVPPVAAGAATEEGWDRLKKMGMIILGFVLYKPAAAIIYASGIRLMRSDGGSDGSVQEAIYGLTIIILAALALPALIKFLVPVAAIGSSSMFSGGAALGAVAAGAAIVSMGGAGAGAAGAGASGAAPSAAPTTPPAAPTPAPSPPQGENQGSGPAPTPEGSKDDPGGNSPSAAAGLTTEGSKDTASVQDAAGAGGPGVAGEGDGGAPGGDSSAPSEDSPGAGGADEKAGGHGRDGASRDGAPGAERGPEGAAQQTVDAPPSQDGASTNDEASTVPSDRAATEVGGKAGASVHPAAAQTASQVAQQMQRAGDEVSEPPSGAANEGRS